MPPTESPVGRSVTVSSLMTSSQEPLPGKTWVVLADEEGGYNVTLPLGFGKYTAGQPRTDGFLQFCILFLLYKGASPYGAGAIRNARARMSVECTPRALDIRPRLAQSTRLVPAALDSRP